MTMTDQKKTSAARIADLITEENKAAYHATEEKYLFCDDLLSSADIVPTPSAILLLEDKLMGLC
jgi:hypothetical protein